MQYAKLVERLLLKGRFCGVLAEQNHRVRSDNFTDFLDLFPSLRKILKRNPGEVCHAAKNPSADGIWSRNSPARSALILVGNITYTEKRSRRAFVFPRSTQDIKDGPGRYVAHDTRLQQILALVIAQGFEWKEVQGAVGRNDERGCRLRFGDRF